MRGSSYDDKSITISGMDVLLDIIKFLKKLQSGQHDIEAGQFELYEGMENVNKALNELKTMKKDVDDMKASNAQQIEIIKDLEVKLDKLNKKYKKNPRARSYSTTYYSDGFGDTLSKKGFKKIHRRIEEVVDITSDVSNKKWNSEESENEGNEHDQSSWTEHNPETEEKPAEEFFLNPEETNRNHRCKNSEMLQRYLQDSAKYRDRRISKASVVSYNVNDRTVQTRPSDIQSVSFWEETNWEDEDEDRRKYSEGNPRTSKPVAARSFCCPVCCKKFIKGIDYSMHKKKHLVIRCRICRRGFTNKEHLKQHLPVHKNKPRNFEGFTCCYCHLVCGTPEKLTAHLRKCRIITKTPCKKASL